MSFLSLRAPWLLGTALVLFATGCDTQEPRDNTFSLEAIVSGSVVESQGVARVSASPASDISEVRMEPLRGMPSEPALAEQYRLSQLTAAILSSSTGDDYSAGYYLIADQTPSGTVFGPASCQDDESCYVLVPNDSRVPGGIFFPVLDGATEGPLLRFRPLGTEVQGRLDFEGASGVVSVDVAGIGAPAVAFARADEVQVSRGSSELETLIVVKRQGLTRTAILNADQSSMRVQSPGEEGTTEVFLLTVE